MLPCNMAFTAGLQDYYDFGQPYSLLRVNPLTGGARPG
jgi:hypothetical protein